MKLISKAALLLVSVISLSQAEPMVFHFDRDHMKDAMDDIAIYWEGKSATYNETYYEKLKGCFHQFNHLLTLKEANLFDSQVAAWKGIADYWKTNATNVDWKGRPDPWGASSPGLDDDKKPFNEYFDRPNVTIGRYNILTYEPCNYASNLAYYHSVTKICDYPDWSTSQEMQHNQMRSMASLAVGSAFMHQSYTYVGARFDNLMISIISYLGHQQMIDNLPYKSNMIKELQNEPRSMNSTQLLDNITNTIALEPVPEWGKALDLGDYPKDYFQNFGAIVSNMACFMLPGFVASQAIQLIATILPKDKAAWVTQQYLPEILKATKHNTMPIKARVSIAVKTVGVLVKIIYAFLFQEQFLNVPGFQTPLAIQIGAVLVPWATALADNLTGFTQTDQLVNDSVNVYPGQPHCKSDQGHSIWHEVSANGLLDLVYLCDYVNSLVIEYIH